MPVKAKKKTPAKKKKKPAVRTANKAVKSNKSKPKKPLKTAAIKPKKKPSAKTTIKKSTRTKKPVTRKKKTTKKQTDIDPPIMSVFLDLFADENLTETQRKVVAIRMMPDSWDMSVKEKADMAGISERQWYRYEHDKAVLESLDEYINRLPNMKLPELFSRLSHDAIKENDFEIRKWATETILKHSKLGIGLARAGAPKNNTNINMSSEEREALKKERLEKRKHGIEQFGVTVKVTG